MPSNNVFGAYTFEDTIYELGEPKGDVYTFEDTVYELGRKKSGTLKKVATERDKLDERGDFDKSTTHNVG